MDYLISLIDYSLSTIRYPLFTICYLLFAIPCLYAAGTSAAEWLKILPGARAQAMGEAFTAIADDKTALYYNPAGLSQLETNEISLTYNRWILDTSLSTIIYGHTFGDAGSVGIGFTYFDSGEIEERQNTKDLSGSFKNTAVSFQVGYGNEFFEGISFGVAAKFITETIKDKSTSGFSADIGLHYKTLFDFGESRFGITIQNIGSRLWEEYPQPNTIRIGAAIMPIKNVLTITADYTNPSNGVSIFSVGQEFIIAEFLSIRAGYKFGNAELKGLSAITLGLGFRYFQDYDYIFNYSFSTQGDLGIIHRAEIGFGF